MDYEDAHIILVELVDLLQIDVEVGSKLDDLLDPETCFVILPEEAGGRPLHVFVVVTT